MKSSKLYFPLALAVGILSAHFAFSQQFTSTRDTLNLGVIDPGLISAYTNIKIDKAWEEIEKHNPTLSSIKIGVIDSGMDSMHPEFQNVNLGNTPSSARFDHEPTGHGTQVAGIIGANNISADGPTNYRPPQMNGLLSGSKNLNYTVEHRYDGGPSLFGVLRSVFEVSTLENVDVVNLSLSFGDPNCNFLRTKLGELAFAALFKLYPWTLFVTSAGETTPAVSNAECFIPGALGGGLLSLPNVVNVGGLDSTGENRWPGSPFGSAVNISAPAENVYSPRPPLAGEVEGQYDKFFGGTSASAPLVTGVAGLIKAIKPGLIPAQIKDILVRNADPITTDTDKPIGGRLNALKAVCDPLVLNCAPTPTPTPTPRPFPNWIQKFPSMNPLARFGHAIAYDSARRQTVLFGGAVSGISGWSLASDTWTWDGADWSLKSPPISPPAVTTGQTYHTMAYDGARQQTVLFLGISCPHATAVKNYTWVWDGTTWISKSPATTPPARYGAAMVYDAARQQTVLFGGFGCGGWLNDTWVWDGATWTQKFPFTNPPVRVHHVMAYDSTRSQTLLFGGTNNGTIINDTWVWDGVNWSQKFPIVSPSARYSSVMVYDETRQEAVLFGGAGRFDIVVNDTWTWDGAEWAQRNPENSPMARAFSGATYDSVRNQVVLFGGNPIYPPIPFDDTWVLGP